MKIYNEIIIDMNPESSSYGETLHEDSFNYEGNLMFMQGDCEEECAEACAHSAYACSFCMDDCEDQFDSPEDGWDTSEDEGGSSGADPSYSYCTDNPNDPVCEGWIDDSGNITNCADEQHWGPCLGDNDEYWSSYCEQNPNTSICSDTWNYWEVDGEIIGDDDELPWWWWQQDWDDDDDEELDDELDEELDDEDDPFWWETEGGVTCWDGSIAENFDACPDVMYDYESPDEYMQDEDYTPPEWWDNPATSEDEFKEFIFDLYRSPDNPLDSEAEKDAWWDTYGQNFPEWEATPQFQQYALTLQQIGISEEQERLTVETHGTTIEGKALEYLAKIESKAVEGRGLSRKMESQFIASGGGASGRGQFLAEETMRLQERDLTLDLTQLHLERDLLDTKYETELYDIAEQRLDYESTLAGIEGDFLSGLMAIYYNNPNFSAHDWEDEEDGSPTLSCEEQCMADGNGAPYCVQYCTDEPEDSASEFEGVSEDEIHEDDWDERGDYDDYDWDDGGWGT